MSSPHSDDRSRIDRGVTLVELLVTVVLIGILIGPIAGGIVVLLRSTPVTSESVDQSRDLRQVVNYLPDDARSGSLLPIRYKTSADADRGSGCDSAGDANVLVIDHGPESSSSSTAYALSSNPDGTASLERFECANDGTVVRQQTVAWNLVDDGITPAASSQLVLDESGEFVERVELRLAQNGGLEVVSASPLEESALQARTQPVSTVGQCNADLLDAALGFSTFGRNLQIGGGQTKISLAGGILSWNGNSEAGKNDTGPNGVGLYVDTIDWAASSGRLRMPGGSGDLVIRNPQDTTIDDQTNIIRVYGPAGSGPTDPYIEVQGGDARFAEPDDLIDFDAQFADLLACSQKLAELPDSCTNGNNCAEHVEFANNNGRGPYEGGSSMAFLISQTKANVLNIPTVEQFEALPNNPNLRWKDGPNGSASIGPNNPLIVTVAEAGDLVIDSAWQSQNNARHILYNFPNATSVIFRGSTTWGTVLAPRARVEIDHNGQFQGGVVAETFVQGNVELNGQRYFEGTIDWDA